jgi:hypothetical protein
VERVLGPQVLRHHGGRIAEENRRRSPVSGSMRRSLTRGAVTSTAPALVSTSRGWWQPLRTTQPPAVLVALSDELGDVALDLGLQGLGQHPPRTVAHDLVDQRRRRRRGCGGVVIAVVGLLGDTLSMGRTFPTGVGAPILLEGLQITRRYDPSLVIHRFQALLPAGRCSP